MKKRHQVRLLLEKEKKIKKHFLKHNQNLKNKLNYDGKFIIIIRAVSSKCNVYNFKMEIKKIIMISDKHNI